MIPVLGALLLQTLAASAVAPTATFLPVMSAQSPAVPAAGAVTGTVQDATGAVIAGAVVVIRSASGAEQQTMTGPDGRFSLNAPGTGDVTLIVRSRGFGDTRQTLALAARQDVVVKLSAAPVTASLTVTPSRSEQRMSEVPASVNVLGREEIRQSPAMIADDVLRQLPTFSLFRRTSSVASHPTTQGVSLRGIGPSGVSRTLVLIDGVPANDPFGGWVYWTRVPVESADRIELVEGSSSSLYGNYALGGVINIVSSPPSRRTFEMKSQYGSLSSPKVDFRASDVWGRVGVVVEGSAFDTEGYVPVAASERGPVDTKASVNFRNINVKVQYNASDRIRAFVRAGYFDEERQNGKFSTFDSTPEANNTQWTSVSGGVNLRLPDRSLLEANVFTDLETFHSNFLAVPNAVLRNVGRVTLNQRVPTRGVGGMAQWSRTAGARQFLSAGTDWRWVKGDSEEDGLDGTIGTSVILRRVSGGRQRSLGVFAQDILSLSPKLTLTLTGRIDRWRNYSGHNLESNVPSGVPTINNAPGLPDRDDTVFSPRVAALYHLTDRVSLWTSVGAGFRAPTLNELYRQFRVGARLTTANNQLGPEHLKSGEIGVRVAPARHMTWRVTWFDNRMTDPISNVSIGVNLLQRQNLGATRIVGVQNDVDYQMGQSWHVTAGYLYNSAKVTENPADTSLVGKFLPQVPRHRGSVDVTYANPRFFTASLIVQSSGMQFDDDVNVARVLTRTEPGLPRYTMVSLSASRRLTRNFEAFVAGQNLFDRVYFVGTGPTTVGSPRVVSAGFRVHVSGR
ncbi:MAG: TonB-dependent receptor [Vicinamibacterales bacterium]